MTTFDGAKFDGPQQGPATTEQAPAAIDPNATANENMQQAEKPKQTVSEEEMKAIIEVPGIVCSKFYVAAQDGAIIRLVFADESADKKFMATRFACVMSIASFMSLAQTIQNTSNHLMQQLMRMNQGAIMPGQPEREKLD